MESRLAVGPADAPVNLLRPPCAHMRRAPWRVSGTFVAQLVSCVLCAAPVCARAAPASLAQTDVLTAPEAVHAVRAEYPPEAAASEREADVVVLATVSVHGDVTAVEIAEHGGDAFDDAALVAARQWKFTPALRDGKPIESQVRLPFHFRHGHAPEEAPAAPPASPAAPATRATPSPSAMRGAPSSGGTANNAPQTAATPAPPGEPPLAPDAERRSYESNVSGVKGPPSRGVSDYHVDVGALSLVPRANATEFLKLAPGILLTNEGGEGHAEQIFLRGFDAREGQDIELTVDGIPINESGNLHGNGYSDLHFIIPELVQSLRVLEGPFDPRQGNYAVAGSAAYHLGLADRGMTAKFTAGSFGTYRMLLSYGPQHMSDGTFAAVELYQTNGYGQNRSGERGSAMAQYEGGSGATRYRLFGQAYISSFHAAGVVRDDDYRSGRVCFYCTEDPLQGEDAQRYSVGVEVAHKSEHVRTQNLVFGIVRPLRLRENFTGFLLDVQEPLDPPHGQRGDLIDLNIMEETVGLRGSARLSGVVLHQPQAIEIGYFARGDFGSGIQQRIEAATGHPYKTDVNNDFRLGDIGLYADLDLRPLRWLALRGGVHGDLFTFDVHNNCAVQDVEHPNPTEPLYGQSCLSEENMGAYREPDQRASTAALAYMPRGSILVGPFWGLSATGSAGEGIRSIDPIYITQDAKTPFAHITSYEGGLSYAHRFRESIDLAASSVVFNTNVDCDLIFSPTSGTIQLDGPTTRIGSASTARL
ncbi:MAG TPA: TonB family protein, partial [Polyangia bacterium]|nr:TonB family protein [Polyangia bacterium]